MVEKQQKVANKGVTFLKNALKKIPGYGIIPKRYTAEQIVLS